MQFHSFACGCPVFPAIFIQETGLSPIVLSWLLCCKLVDPYAWIYFWALCFVSLIYMSGFIPISYCFHYYSFIIYWVGQKVLFGSSVRCYGKNQLFGQTNSLKLGSIVTPVQRLPWLFRIFSSIQILGLFILLKNVTGILREIALILYIVLSSTDVLTVLILPGHEHGVCFHLCIFQFFFH